MKLLIAALSLAALAFAGSALSQQKESGIYIGGALGQAEQSDQCSSTAPGVSCDNKDSAWKIFGGFQFSRYFAAELGYANLGEASASAGAVSATDEATAIELVALGMFPVVERFSIFGKLGFASVDVDTPLGGDTKTELTYGIGAQYDVTPMIGARVQWQRYDTDQEIDLLSIGVVVRF